MARKRTPSPDQQASDRLVIRHCSSIVNAVAERYPATILDMAVRCLDEFVKSPVVQRKRKAPKKVEVA